MDDEVLETAAPPAPKKDVEMGGEDDENEDVQCTGRTGDNALMDFPHARENCCVVKFVQGQVPRTRIGTRLHGDAPSHGSASHPPPCALG